MQLVAFKAAAGGTTTTTTTTTAPWIRVAGVSSAGECGSGELSERDARRMQAAQASADTNVVVVGWNDATSSVTGVTDSAGNVYQVGGARWCVGPG